MARQRHAASEMDFATRRMRRRLRQDLGVNLAGIEIILQMRVQVQSLQARVRELETELNESKRRGTRFAQYRDNSIEATWVEIGEEQNGSF